MPTFQSESSRNNRGVALAEPPSNIVDFPERDPAKAARLSLIPGVGQIYNGDKRRGYLFLAVTAVNVLILTWMLFSDPILKGIEYIFAFANVQVHWESIRPLQIRLGGGLSYVLLGLMVSFSLFASHQARDFAIRLRKGYHPRLNLVQLSETTSSSYLVHFAAMMAFLVLIVFFIAPKEPEQQITDIELVQQEPPPRQNPKPAAKPKAPEPVKPVVTPPKPQPVKPVAPTPIAVVSPKPAPNMVPLPPAAPPAPPTTDSSGSAGGSGSGSGDGDGASGNGNDVDYGSWLQAMQRKIKKTWFPPRGNESNKIVVSFKAHKDGTITGIKMVTSSGLAIADSAAVEAIKQAQPLPPLPAGSPDVIQINFKFDYDVFNGGMR